MEKYELLQLPTEHLGDGAYASFTGYSVIVWAERDFSLHWVSLDPFAFDLLRGFCRRYEQNG